MRLIRRVVGSVVLLVAVCVGFVACSMSERLAALQNLNLSIDRVSDVALAGMRLDNLEHGGSLDALGMGRVGLALATGKLPLEGIMHVSASNPGTAVAEFLALDWSLLLDGRDTVGGTVDRPASIASGASADIPVSVRLDLLRFFSRDAGKLLDVAQAFMGNGHSNVGVGLRVFPILQTPFGPLRSPYPLMLNWNGGNRHRS